MPCVRAVPVLQVADVARSLAWYRDVLGFQADPFPDATPYSFAILTRDRAELMLQCGEDLGPRPTGPGWAVYLRCDGGKLLDLAATVAQRSPLLRGPERMFYGQVEFEVADPDGHRLCLAEPLGPEADVPTFREQGPS